MMGAPRKKTEYRLMTPAEIRQDLERRLYQADKVRAEYAAKAQQKAREAEAWGRRTGAQIGTGARQFQLQVQSSADQALKAGQTRAQALGQRAERGAAGAVQSAQRLQRAGAARLQRGAAVVALQREELARRGAQTAQDMTGFADQARNAVEGSLDQWSNDGRQAFEEASDQADAWGRIVEDGARRALKATGDYAGQAVEAIIDAPYNADRAVRQWWRDGTRDLQKYSQGPNDYERSSLFEQFGITDPNSEEARALTKYVSDARLDTFNRWKGAWDGLPAGRRLASSAALGFEQGALKGLGEIARGVDLDPETSFDETYFTNRLPRTFAREEHPFVYLASHGAGSLISDAALAGINPGLVPVAEVGGAAARGFVSEPGDLRTRLTNALGEGAATYVGGQIAKPIGRYVGKELRELIGVTPKVRLPRRIEPTLGPDEKLFEKAGKVGDKALDAATGEALDSSAEALNDRRKKVIEQNRRKRQPTP